MSWANSVRFFSIVLWGNQFFIEGIGLVTLGGLWNRKLVGVILVVRGIKWLWLESFHVWKLDIFRGKNINIYIMYLMDVMSLPWRSFPHIGVHKPHSPSNLVAEEPRVLLLSLSLHWITLVHDLFSFGYPTHTGCTCKVMTEAVSKCQDSKRQAHHHQWIYVTHCLKFSMTFACDNADPGCLVKLSKIRIRGLQW